MNMTVTDESIHQWAHKEGATTGLVCIIRGWHGIGGKYVSLPCLFFFKNKIMMIYHLQGKIISAPEFYKTGAAMNVMINLMKNSPYYQRE